MDTKKGPLNPAFDRNHYIYVIVDQFSNYNVTVPISKNNAYHDANSIIHNWMSKYGPLHYLITDKRTERLNSEMAKCSTVFEIGHSPGTSHVPWTNGLEVQNKNLGTHLRMFLPDNPDN